MKLTSPFIALAREIRAAEQAEQEIKKLEDKRMKLTQELQPPEPIDITHLKALLDDLAFVLGHQQAET